MFGEDPHPVVDEELSRDASTGDGATGEGSVVGVGGAARWAAVGQYRHHAALGDGPIGGRSGSFDEQVGHISAVVLRDSSFAEHHCRRGRADNFGRGSRYGKACRQLRAERHQPLFLLPTVPDLRCHRHARAVEPDRAAVEASAHQDFVHGSTRSLSPGHFIVHGRSGTASRRSVSQHAGTCVRRPARTAPKEAALRRRPKRSGLIGGRTVQASGRRSPDQPEVDRAARAALSRTRVNRAASNSSG